MPTFGPEPESPPARWHVLPTQSGPPLHRRLIGVPALVDGPLIIAVSEHAAVGVDSIVAYPDGFEVRVSAVLRNPFAREHLGEIVMPTFRMPDTGWTRGFVSVAVTAGEEIVFTNTEKARRPDRGGGYLGFTSSTPRRADASMFVGPIPEFGPVEIHARWLSAGLDEAAVAIDLDRLVAAAAEVTDWP